MTITVNDNLKKINPQDAVGRVVYVHDEGRFYLIVDMRSIYHAVDLANGVLIEQSSNSCEWLIALMNDPNVTWYTKMELSK